VLEEAPIAQPFERLVHLRRGERPESAAAPDSQALRASFAARWRDGALPDDVFRRPEATYESRCTCGMAWIARRELLDRHGLYDTMILGLGDKHIAAAATGRAGDAAAATEMSESHGQHYRRWADGLWADVGGNVGCVAGSLFHLWHGDLANRHYLQRYRGFGGFAFDPERDLELDQGGAWRWRRDDERIRRHVADYFRGRREDEGGGADSPRLVAGL
jgi:hypothetical protein